METDELLALIFVHDILTVHMITEPLDYLELRRKLAVDEDFVEYLRAYRKLLEK